MSNSTFHSTTPGGPSTGYGANAHTTATAKSNALVANGETILFNIQNRHEVLRQTTLDISRVKNGTASAAAMLLATLPQKLMVATTRAFEQALRDSLANGNAELNTSHYRKTIPDPNPNNLPPSNEDLENLFFLFCPLFLSTRQSDPFVRSHRFFVFFLYFPQCLAAVASNERCVVDNGHCISRRPPATMVGTVVATRAVTWHNPN